MTASKSSKKLWRIGIVVGVVVVVAGAGTFAALRLRNNSSSDAYTEIVTVQRGNLTATISPTGEVSAEKRVELGFDVTRIPLIEMDVVAGQKVKQGDVLARIDTQELQQAVDQAAADALSAEEALAQAKDPYTDLDLQKAQLDVSVAQVAVDEANQELADLQNPDSSAIEQAKHTLEQAQANLAALKADTSTQDQINRLKDAANAAEVYHGALLTSDLTTELGQDHLLIANNRMLDAEDALETAEARAALDELNAENQVTTAQQALADLQSGNDTLALDQAKNKVAQAEYNLAQANENLATVQAGPDAKAVQLAQGKYDAAEATLEDAKATLESATMVAPFDGTVLSVGAQVGDLVSSGTTIVTMADLSNLQVTATVDETDISQVQVGQDAEITFDAFAGQTFQGKVLEVPLEGTLSQNVVTYDVLLSLEGAEDVGLRSGMTANVTIVIGRRQNVLLVPTLAIQQSDQGNVVEVQASANVTVEVPVELGLSNGTYTEVTSGLQEGDKVVVHLETTSSQTNPFGGFGGQGAGPVIIRRESSGGSQIEVGP